MSDRIAEAEWVLFLDGPGDDQTLIAADPDLSALTGRSIPHVAGPFDEGLIVILENEEDLEAVSCSLARDPDRDVQVFIATVIGSS